MNQRGCGSGPSRPIQTAIVKPYAYIPAGYKAGVMPSNFGTTLKKNEITALVNYLTKATGK